MCCRELSCLRVSYRYALNCHVKYVEKISTNVISFDFMSFHFVTYFVSFFKNFLSKSFFLPRMTIAFFLCVIAVNFLEQLPVTHEHLLPMNESIEEETASHSKAVSSSALSLVEYIATV